MTAVRPWAVGEPITNSGGQTLWLADPARRWVDGFPIGNGRLGAMLFGGTEHERLALNHENLWRGVTRDRTTEPQHQHLPEIREALLAGRWIEGAELATKYLSGHDRRVQPYQPLGDLTLTMPGHGSVTDYIRSLRLDAGIVEVSYRVGDTVHARQVFASAEHGVIVLRLSADRPGAVTAAFRLDRIPDPDCEIRPWSSGNRFGFDGSFAEGIAFAVEARVAPTGGRITPGDGALLAVDGADDLLLVLTMAVDHNQPDPTVWCARCLDTVPMDFDTLAAAHVAEHRSYYHRVALDLGRDPETEALPLDKRLARFRAGGEDAGLAALLFHYGRYLLISSSRKCDQPANLQGIWNEELRPPWESDIHCDCNIQMNYWPAEVCNLPECLEPLFDFIWRTVPQAQKAARDLYDCRGVCFCLHTDIWDRATPETPGWDVWTGAAAWLAQHLWWRYEYSLDEGFLRERVYPFVKLVAEFYEDYLLRDERGRLVTVPSQSPENFFVGGAKPVSLCVGATMDLLLIREVLRNCLCASAILAVDAERGPVREGILRDLPPFQIGRHGQLQEWLEDFEEGEPGHRHVSHLYGVFPGDQMTPEALPEFYRAARVSLERRLEAGGVLTWGGSQAWKVCLWARFLDGERAYNQLMEVLTDYTTDSLLAQYPCERGGILSDVFQIDGNFAGAAAIAEMLVQSHEGVIRLLPALPAQWPEGHVRGLVARGGFLVDLTWRARTLVEARLSSRLGGACRILPPEGTWRLWCAGETISAEQDARGVLGFETSKGQKVILRPDQVCAPGSPGPEGIASSGRIHEGADTQ